MTYCHDWTDAEIQENIEKLEQNICSCKKKIERYKAEQERRKQEVPLGVPLESNLYGGILGTYYFCFASDKAKRVFDGRLNDYVEALQKIAKGEQIDIKVLLPLLKKGWVAMDKNGGWHWYKEKPYIEKYYYSWNSGSPVSFIGGFNIKPADDWRKSLMECGL